MNLHPPSIWRAAWCAFLVLAGSFGPIAAGADTTALLKPAQVVTIRLDAAEMCNQAGWFPDGAMPVLGDIGCVSPLRGGAAIFYILFDGLFREAHLRSTFLVPSAPPRGSSPLGVQFLNHLVVAYAFDEEGIKVALIGDQGDFPPPPSYLEGNMLGTIAYGVPFEISVHTTMEAHRIRVRQAGEVIVSAAVEKAVRHSDPLTYQSFFVDSIPVGNTLEWSSVSAVVQAVRSSGEDSDFPAGPAIGTVSMERVGNTIRVIRNHY